MKAKILPYVERFVELILHQVIEYSLFKYNAQYFDMVSDLRLHIALYYHIIMNLNIICIRKKITGQELTRVTYTCQTLTQDQLKKAVYAVKM